jgi:hypothetical protein
MRTWRPPAAQPLPFSCLIISSLLTHPQRQRSHMTSSAGYLSRMKRTALTTGESGASAELPQPSFFDASCSGGGGGRAEECEIERRSCVRIRMQPPAAHVASHCPPFDPQLPPQTRTSTTPKRRTAARPFLTGSSRASARRFTPHRHCSGMEAMGCLASSCAGGREKGGGGGLGGAGGHVSLGGRDSAAGRALLVDCTHVVEEEEGPHERCLGDAVGELARPGLKDAVRVGGVQDVRRGKCGRVHENGGARTRARFSARRTCSCLLAGGVDACCGWRCARSTCGPKLIFARHADTFSFSLPRTAATPLLRTHARTVVKSTVRLLTGKASSRARRRIRAYLSSDHTPTRLFRTI